METTPTETGLGNLAQSTRIRQLKIARGILYAVGGLTVIVNIGLCIFAGELVDREFKKEVAKVHAQGMEVDNAKLAEARAGAIRSLRLVDGIAVLIGIVFIVCGVLVYKHPVPVTILSLVLYIGSAAVYGVIDPHTLAQGWIVKILIVAGLFKAVQAALAYENERKRDVATPIAALE